MRATAAPRLRGTVAFAPRIALRSMRVRAENTRSGRCVWDRTEARVQRVPGALRWWARSRAARPRCWKRSWPAPEPSNAKAGWRQAPRWATDRKSTRLNSSYVEISYAVFCLKKKKKKNINIIIIKKKKKQKYTQNER